MRRVLWVALAAVIVLLPHSGEGGEGESREAKQASPPENVLRVGVTTIASLDPSQARSTDQVLVVDQMFDSLTAVDSTTLEPVPSLAARWQSSTDQRQWDFFLRPGAAFSNGRPINSGDVKYTLERIARSGSGSPVADLLKPVNGYEPFRVKGTAPGLAGITTPAPDVVHFNLDQPLATLANVLASPVFGVVPRESVEALPPAPPFSDEPVTSGPFMLRRHDDDVVSVVAVAGARMRLSGIDFIQYDDADAAYEAFTKGDLDVARVPSEDIAAAGQRYGRTAFGPYLGELFYGFNLRSPKFADLRFREAIVRAIDRRAIVSAIYQGTARPIDGPVPEGATGHQPDPCGRCAYDPARAKALLAEAFPGKPVPEVAIDYDDDEAQEAIAKAVQASLQQVGIPATLRPRLLREYNDFALSGQQELFRLGWVAPYPSADAVLPSLFATDSDNNVVGISNPAIDAQLRAARSESDPVRRAQLYRDAERAIMDQLPVLPIAQFRLHSVVSKRVKNLKLNSMGSFDATVVELD